MPGVVSVSTPQFRTALIRKLKNIAPACRVEFLEADRGVAFRMIDGAGRVRSMPISIYRNSGGALQTSTLERRLRSAGFPGVFKR